ncbi:alpha-amylase family glycosyl hydrolase, partial [Acinetobacter baumannii]
NRGNSTYSGENSRFGDFSGLDDLFTENPRVRDGMIAIYAKWIADFGIDGYRIDTARHVDPGFWQAFVPAMQQAARKRGIP